MHASTKSNWTHTQNWFCHFIYCKNTLDTYKLYINCLKKVNIKVSFWKGKQAKWIAWRQKHEKKSWCLHCFQKVCKYKTIVFTRLRVWRFMSFHQRKLPLQIKYILLNFNTMFYFLDLFKDLAGSDFTSRNEVYNISPEPNSVKCSGFFH